MTNINIESSTLFSQIAISSIQQHKMILPSRYNMEDYDTLSNSICQQFHMQEPTLANPKPTGLPASSPA